MKELEKSIKINSKVFAFAILFTIPNLIFGQRSENKLKKNESFPTKSEIVSFSPLITNNFSSNEYYMKTLGFMCKLEIGVEKQNKIPIKIRLGTQEYVDKLEKKIKN